MKTRIFIIVVVLFLLSRIKVVAQDNVLSGVYVSVPEKIIKGDTIKSYISGKVLDSITLDPISNAVVAIFSTRGDAIKLVTDSVGYFEYKKMEIGNLNFKIICSIEPEYMNEMWELSTIGMERPIQINGYFFMKKK